GPGGGAGSLRHEHASLPETVAELRPHATLEHVPARFEVALGGSDVHPVAIEPLTVQPLAHQTRNDLSLDREPQSTRDQLDDARLEHVSGRGDLIGVDILRGGRLENPEPLDARSSGALPRPGRPVSSPDEPV